MVDWQYDRDTGVVSKAGRPMGSVGKDGYVRMHFNGRVERAHRLAYILQGLPLPAQVDHINGNRSDNRWANLRGASNMENQYNRKGTSKVGRKKGAYYNAAQKQWYSLIRFGGKRVYLGTFKDEDAAHAAYVAAASKHHREFARSK
ncbi:HNH family homing endonuclease [Pectobacterium phage PP16]|uniref:HNH family homing endonuclease n=1 Tax=Pectobacterium phage PP16 TaxID=1873958 RepID=A0A1B1PEB0_9CAUD|nr:HNH family homing endonuclease [Pectobacterium phage PP16]ANT45312.1 HNH family homing endonuclease [Pectobacterium phage PP16]